MSARFHVFLNEFLLFLSIGKSVSSSFRRTRRHTFLAVWLGNLTLQRERKLLEEHAPRFLTELADVLKAMRDRKQKLGGKEEDEQGDELQTEG